MAKKKTINDLKFDDHNFNRHTDEGMELLDKSIKENGFGRSILVDKNDNIVCGNGVVETAKKQGQDNIIVVETDGEQLVVVKRKDLDINSTKGRNLAYADNSVANVNLKWDEEQIDDARKQFGLSPAEWGGAMTAMEKKETKTEQLSKLRFEDIYYTPKETPMLKLEDCYDLELFNAKLKAIEESKLPKAAKEVMKIFAYRFIRIDFESVANYYEFNASEEEKRMIERLRLVLVDGSLDGFINDDILRINEYIKDYAENE